VSGRGFLLSAGALALVAASAPLYQRWRPPPAMAAATATPAPRPAAADRPGPKAARSPFFLGVVLATESVEVAARFAGRVKAVHVRMGDRVAAGDRLATLDTVALRQELAMAEAAADAQAAEAGRQRLAVSEAGQQLARSRALAGQEVAVISAEDLAAAEFREREADLGAAAAQARLAERRAHIARLRRQIAEGEIRAPFAGVVAARHVDTGATVAEGSPVMRLISADVPRVRFAVPHQGVAALKVGADVAVAVDGLATPRKARVEKIAPELDAAAMAVLVEARFIDQLPPAVAGRRAEVRAHGAEHVHANR
jgi:RND family efflux transporter MFP subunit